jgi:hypothetical protein
VALGFAAGPLAAENRVWTEADSGEPGEEVTVVIKATTDRDVEVGNVHVRFSARDLTYLGHDFSLGAIANSIAVTTLLSDASFPGELTAGFRKQQAGSPIPAGEGWECCRLRFRIRAGAPPGPCLASIVLNSVALPLVRTEFYDGYSTIPLTIDPGVVVVEPATRPVPPDAFNCLQDLASVRLAWQDSLAYESLLLSRDGELLAELPGDAESFTDAEPPHGDHTYALTGVWDGTETVTVTCRLSVQRPAAEAVRDLVCDEVTGGVSLSWENGRTYSAIQIRRNGDVLAELPGSETTYDDATKPPGTAFYEVVGFAGVVPSMPVSCVVGGESSVRISSVTVRPGGGTVLVPVYCTNPMRITALVVGFGYDSTRVRVLTHSIEGTVMERAEPFLRFDTFGEDEVRFAFSFCPFGCWSMPPAVDTCYLKIVLEVLPTAQEGDVIPLQVRHAVASPPHDTCFVDVANSGCYRVERMVDGEIIVGMPRVKGVRDLAVAPTKDSGAVRLTWHNAEPYDALEVERDGALLCNLGGDAEGVGDAVPGNGVFCYRVRGERDGTWSPWATALHTELPGVALFRRGNANGDQRIDLADAMEICGHIFRGRPAPCEDAMDTNDDGDLNVADAVFLLSYLFVDGEEPLWPGPQFRRYDPTPDLLGCAGGTP